MYAEFFEHNLEHRSNDEAAHTTSSEDNAHGEAAVLVKIHRGDGHDGKVVHRRADTIEDCLCEV